MTLSITPKHHPDVNTPTFVTRQRLKWGLTFGKTMEQTV